MTVAVETKSRRMMGEMFSILPEIPAEMIIFLSTISLEIGKGLETVKNQLPKEMIATMANMPQALLEQTELMMSSILEKSAAGFLLEKFGPPMEPKPEIVSVYQMLVTNLNEAKETTQFKAEELKHLVDEVKNFAVIMLKNLFLAKLEQLKKEEDNCLAAISSLSATDLDDEPALDERKNKADSVLKEKLRAVRQKISSLTLKNMNWQVLAGKLEYQFREAKMTALKPVVAF